MGFLQLLNMNFGFLGIQFGWALQMANMSAIYRFLGAEPDGIPFLWLAAPLTGLIIQPIIGHMSDHTWGRLGRRRPYFLVGAVLSTIALVLMPNSSTLMMAVVLLWVLDCSINVSMEPFRAFVSDLLPEEQRTHGFAMQSILIGLGAIIASALPYLLTRYFHLPAEASGAVPLSIRLSFYLGAVAFFVAVMWTVVTTPEHPPEDMEAFRRQQERQAGLRANVREVVDCLGRMPATMRQLALVQIFTWLGLFCMWLYFSGAVAHNVWGVDDPRLVVNGVKPYQEAVEWGGICFSLYSVVTFAFSFLLTPMADRLGRKATHAMCLAAGATGLIGVYFIHDRYLLLLSMAGVGIAWASILSMPYAMLAGCLPEGKTGTYMGIFNFFIVIPEIVAALGFGWVMTHVLHNDSVLAVVAGGVSLLVAAALVLRVEDRVPARIRPAGTAE